MNGLSGLQVRMLIAARDTGKAPGYEHTRTALMKKGMLEYQFATNKFVVTAKGHAALKEIIK
jgi:hypothetical protein